MKFIRLNKTDAKPRTRHGMVTIGADETGVTVWGEDGTPIPLGTTGKSAYQIARDHGYGGTETQWLATLKGEPGEDGADGADAGPHDHPYASDDHTHPAPDLSGLATSDHMHDTAHDHAEYAATAHDHPLPAHDHSYADPDHVHQAIAHDHDAAYAPTHSGHAHTHTAGDVGAAATSHSHADGDLPAGLARDAEVTAVIATHAATPHGSSAPVYADLGAGSALALGTNDVVSVSPTANTTYTTTVPAAGRFRKVIVRQTTATSRTLTFGSGFKPSATLATGTTAARIFVVSFVSDGANLIETGRTAAIPA